LLQVLLGLFVVGQLVFLPTANVTTFLDAQGSLTEGPASKLQPVHRLTQAWSGVTLQTEFWSLFAEFPRRSLFPAVEVIPDADAAPAEGPLLLRSHLEPADPAHFFSANVAADRLHNYEAWLTQVFFAWERHTALADPEKRQEALRDFVRVWQGPLLAYMQWRLRQPDVPSVPSGEVLLTWRVFETAKPPGTANESSPPCHRHEVVRWRPGAKPREGSLPLEVYDPQGRRYLEVTTER
jgi:hypothetical protein